MNIFKSVIMSCMIRHDANRLLARFRKVRRKQKELNNKICFLQKCPDDPKAQEKISQLREQIATLENQLRVHA